jgi:hypothetical protein
MTESSAEVAYVQLSPLRRRLQPILYALLLIAVIVGVWFAQARADRWYYMRNYRRDADVWYAASLNWREPTTTLKYTENPADAPPGGRFRRSYGKPGSTASTGFQTFGGGFVERRPGYYEDGRPALTGTPDQVMLVMHQRTTSDGSLTRLIAVGDPRFDGNSLGLEIDQIGMLNGDYRVLRGGYRKIDMTGIAGPGEIRIFAGQPDPNDASRFSIPFEARGQIGFIDGVYEPGPSFSKDPENAKIEAEMNANVKLTIHMPGITRPETQPASRAAAASEPQ